MIDPDQGAVYTAEDIVKIWLDRGSVTAFGSTWILEPEVRFARVEDVQLYVDQVLAHIGCDRPVKVRRRRGVKKAHYERFKQTIAIPDENLAGSEWALREATVLHELAHHLDVSGGPSHGPGFRAVHLDLLRRIGRPVHATLLQIAYAEEVAS